MATRKDFIAAALILNRRFEYASTFATIEAQSAARETVKEIAADMAADFRRNNANFDHGRFIRACFN